MLRRYCINTYAIRPVDTDCRSVTHRCAMRHSQMCSLFPTLQLIGLAPSTPMAED